LGSHAGTHVDAPRHLFEQGTSVDGLALDTLIGPVRVVDCVGVTAIAAARLGPDDLSAGRVLFKTRSAHEASGGCLTSDLAAACICASVRLVGLDAISVDAASDPDLPVHRALLGAGIAIVEGLDLTRVPAGTYELFCLPLKIANGDGAPARVLLRSSMD